MTLKHLKYISQASQKSLKESARNPLKNKTGGRKKVSGRNHTGKITVRHRGGGNKRSHRKITFLSTFDSAVLERLEYDPSRSARIARLFSIISKRHFYIIAPERLKVGSLLQRKSTSENGLGNSCVLGIVPLGIFLHCIGTSRRKSRGVFQRSAGTFGQLVQKGLRYCIVRFSSGENKRLLAGTFAVVGRVSNRSLNKVLGKAGRNRWKGFRPTVRGVSMNPIDHPHGGGEGKSSGGRPSVTPWAKPSHGVRTKKKSN
jgi:large subunit ribosomal protein L2